MADIEIGTKWKWVGPENYWADHALNYFKTDDEFVVKDIRQDFYGTNIVRLYRAEWPDDQVNNWVLSIDVYATDFVQFFEQIGPSQPAMRKQVLGNCNCSARMLLWGGHEKNCPHHR